MAVCTSIIVSYRVAPHYCDRSAARFDDDKSNSRRQTLVPVQPEGHDFSPAVGRANDSGFSR